MGFRAAHAAEANQGDRAPGEWMRTGWLRLHGGGGVLLPLLSRIPMGRRHLPSGDCVVKGQLATAHLCVVQQRAVLGTTGGITPPKVATSLGVPMFGVAFRKWIRKGVDFAAKVGLRFYEAHYSKGREGRHASPAGCPGSLPSSPGKDDMTTYSVERCRAGTTTTEADTLGPIPRDSWGLSPTMVDRLDVFARRAVEQGLRDPFPRIVSGYRSPDVQRRMQERWDRGEREGLVTRPADVSAHTRGEAVDLRGTAAELHSWGVLWISLGGTWGGSWVDADPVHYQL